MTEEFIVVITQEGNPRASGKNKSDKEPMVVKAQMPEQVSAGIQSEYEDPFQIDVGVKTAALIKWVSKKVIGSEVSHQWNRDNLFVWMGSTPFEFTLELEFVVENDSYEDVVLPVKRLLKMASPKLLGNTALMPPKPVSIQIGKVLKMIDCYLVGVNPEITKPFVIGGIPSKVACSITIQTGKKVNQQDIDKWFF